MSGILKISSQFCFLSIFSLPGNNNPNKVPAYKALEMTINQLLNVEQVNGIIVTGYPRNMRDVVEYMAKVTWHSFEMIESSYFEWKPTGLALNSIRSNALMASSYSTGATEVCSVRWNLEPRRKKSILKWPVLNWRTTSPTSSRWPISSTSKDTYTWWDAIESAVGMRHYL